MKLSEIREQLTIKQVFDFVEYLGAEPVMKNGYFISRTICHNHTGDGSYKLYYYDNSKRFKCYTDCGDSFDIFELYMRSQQINSLSAAISVITDFFHISTEENHTQINGRLKDWEFFDKIDIETKEKRKEEEYQLPYYDAAVLAHLPHLRVAQWEREGISATVIQEYGIAYNPLTHAIVIPHYDINNHLVGIRERAMTKDGENNGKYRPSVFNNVIYSHPLGLNLYNLNKTKNNIKKVKKAIVVEGEKSSLLYASYYGIKNNICVACCGSSLLIHQADLLFSLGVQEIIIGLDKQFQEVNDTEWQKLVKNFYSIHNKYSKYVQISYLFDTNNLLDYKDSPLDKGKDVFEKLFKERIVI